MASSTCIAGIGESAVGQVPDRSTLQLQTDAARAALADACLTFDYIDGLITLHEGPRMMSRLDGVEPAAVRIGMPVQVGFDDIDETVTLPVFRPKAA